MAIKKKGKLDQILDKLTEHDEKFKGIDARFDQQDKKFDKMADKLLEHDEIFGNIAGRFDQVDRRFDEMDDKLGGFRNEILTGLDKVMGELEKAREDRELAKEKDDELERRLEKVEA